MGLPQCSYQLRVKLHFVLDSALTSATNVSGSVRSDPSVKLPCLFPDVITLTRFQPPFTPRTMHNARSHVMYFLVYFFNITYYYGAHFFTTIALMYCSAVNPIASATLFCSSESTTPFGVGGAATVPGCNP